MVATSGLAALPPLLRDFAGWLDTQPPAAVGYFEVIGGPVGDWFGDPAVDAKLAGSATAFAGTPDGSQVVLVDPGGDAPPAVVFLGSEGEIRTIADSPEEFLVLLAGAETGVGDLDDGDAAARERLGGWLAGRGVSVPAAPDFDLGEFLDGTAVGANRPAAPAPVPTGPGYPGLSPLTERVALLVGRRADDPDVVGFIRDELGKRPVTAMGEVTTSAWVEAGRTHGLDLLFQYDLRHPAYPVIRRSSLSFVPYLSMAYFRPGYPDALPSGARTDLTAAAAAELLGAPTGTRGTGRYRRSYWQRPIDPARGLVLDVDPSGDPVAVALRIDPAWLGGEPPGQQ